MYSLKLKLYGQKQRSEKWIIIFEIINYIFFTYFFYKSLRIMWNSIQSKLRENLPISFWT
jgi:hypothetical protein